MADLRQELLAAFAVEHRELLVVVRLAAAMAGSGRSGDLRSAFRAAHSLKGAARAVDLPRIEEIAHQLESVFDALIAGGGALPPEAVEAIGLAADAIEAEAAHPDGPPSPLANDALAMLRLVVASTGRTPTAVRRPARSAATRPPPPPPADAEPLPAKPEPAKAPPPAAPPPVEMPSPAAATEVTPLPAPPLRAAVADAPPPPEPEPAPPGPPAATEPGAPAAYLRIPADRVEQAGRALYDLDRAIERRIGGGRAGDLAGDLRALRREAETGRARGEAVSPALLRGLAAAEREAVGLAQRERLLAAGLAQAADRLRTGVERLSLASVDSVFAGLGAMVREMARGAGKEVEVTLAGFGLEAERRLLAALKDPVNHLIRNAISHGAETPAERTAAGRPPAVAIGIAFAVRADMLTVTVTDDGRGPDLARIEDTAVRRGVLPARAAGERPPPVDRLMDAVFEDGFSTASEVDRLAGRGVGLAVVAATARRLRGFARLRPRRPHGAEAQIAVPLSAARQSVLLAEAGGSQLALPGAAVERLLRLPMERIDRLEGRPVLRLAEDDDGVVPLVPLATLAGFADAALPSEAGMVKAAVLARAGRRLAVAVDGFADAGIRLVSEVNAPGVDRNLVAGAVFTGADQPVLVLSADGLFERWRELERQGRFAGSVAAAVAEAPPAPHTVLVVDDSITTRTLEKSILEAHGYRVLLSVDGVDALTRLRSEGDGIALVVADIEMPRMDGFALLRAIKDDPRLAGIPVVLMTSRAAPEDIRRGLDLGADAYVTKQKFDQRELLDTIGQLL